MIIKDNDGVIWSPPCLIRWPHMFEPSLPKGADPSKTPQFSLCAVLSGNEPQYDEFRQAIIEEMNRAAIDKHGAAIPEMQNRGRYKLAMKGNMDQEAGKQGQAGFKERPDGSHFNATTQFAPAVVDKSPAGGGVRLGKDQAANIYDGIFGRVGVTAWGWTHPTGGKGVSFNLQGLIKVFDGTKLGGVTADVDGVDVGDYVPEGALTGGPAPDAQPSSASDQQQQQPSGDGGAGAGGGGFGF